jgi:hypothetical protein
VRESGSQPLLERLKDELRDKRLLLLLDNFELRNLEMPRQTKHTISDL